MSSWISWIIGQAWRNYVKCPFTLVYRRGANLAITVREFQQNEVRQKKSKLL